MTKSIPRIVLLGSICLLCTGICLLSPSTATAGTRWAILIGVNQYPKDVTTTTAAPNGQLKLSWPDLNFAVQDVRALRDSLLAVGYEAQNVVVIDSDAADPALRPIKQNIVNQLLAWSRRPDLKEDDSVMVVFTGHGFTEEGESLLCPSNIDINNLQKSGISVSWISELLANSKVAQRFLIVDACRNEVSNIGLTQFNMLTGLRKLALQQKNDAAQPAPATPQGIVYFASCLAGQRSIEDPTLGHGVFLHFFTKGLRGLADVQPGGDRNKQVSPYEAFKFAADETRRWTRREFSWEQQPWVEGRSTNDLHLSEIPADDHAKLIADATTSQTQAPSAFALQGQYDLELAILALHGNDLPEAVTRVEESIRFDPSNVLARQTRAMLYLLESTQSNQVFDEDSEEMGVVAVPNYAQALNQMRAVNRPLLVRVSGDVDLRFGTKSVTIAKQGDVLHGNAIVEAGAEKWLQVVGIQRKGKTHTEAEKLVGFVSLTTLSQNSNGYDQLQEFDSRNQQPGYLVRGGSGGGGNGGGGQRAAAALQWVNFGLGIGRGGVGIPSIPTGDGYNWRQHVPYGGGFY